MMEIKLRKFSEQFPRRRVIGAGRFDFAVKAAEMPAQSGMSNLRVPPTIALAPRDAFIVTASLDALSCVGIVLAFSAFAQILTSIIERIVIVVIHILATVHNFAMHLNEVSVMRASSIKGSRMGTPYCIPVESTQQFKIARIHNRILSLRQGNQTIGLVKWLRNGMPLPRLSGHFLPPSRIWYAAILAGIQGAE